MRNKPTFYRQLDFMDCGPTCMKMVAAHYGKDYPLDYLRANTFITRSGVSLLNLSDVAEKIGFRTLKVKLDYDTLIQEAPLPCILHWNQEHYVVLYSVKKNPLRLLSKSVGEHLVVADPGSGVVTIDKETFLKCWMGGHKQAKGIALIMEPTPEFYRQEEHQKESRTGFKFLLNYLYPYKSYLFQLFLGMLFGSIVSMIFPFLTQSLVDFGVHRHNLDFIHLVLVAQLFLFLGNITIDMIRNWILLHINARLSVSIISNFLIKLMKLPISFFESKNIGDITQRINDHHRIENFLTGSTLSTCFSILNLIVYSIVLGSYGFNLLLIFLIGGVLSIAWVFIFLSRRKNLDYVRFQRQRENQSSIYELVVGMQEIKLNNAEKARRWEWERIQAKLFRVNIKSLSLEQYQEIGSSFITQLKNILITYFAATQVIENQITLGAMLSITYIVGQMNGPLSQIISFMKTIQDAKLSLDRLGEIHDRPNEELDEEVSLGRKMFLSPTDEAKEGIKLNGLISNFSEGITLHNVSFRYGGNNSPLVLKNINMHIPKGKVTAIVGSSGSGKSTLLKLLLKFYPPTEGDIHINGTNFEDLSSKEWRNQCGTVMQDGFIFSDTIAHNIAVDGQKIDEERLLDAVRTANLQDYVRKIPLGFSTRIGNTGSGLSGGQRQRMFIARAVYKNPGFIFFDEATSALDANNERVIMENLDRFFDGRTVLIIAHRLSTVKNADQIIVLENGEIKECGNHKQLTARKGLYFELVKNQLELDAA